MYKKYVEDNLWDLGSGRVFKFDTKSTVYKKENLLNWTS